MAAPVDADDVMRALLEFLAKKKMKPMALFSKLDEDEGGTIDAKELRKGLKDLGFTLTDEEFKAMMSRVDKDGGGEISIREFDRAIKAAEKLPKKHKVDAALPPDIKRKQTGLTKDDMEDFRQIFCLFKQLCRPTIDEQGREVPLVEWDPTGSISVDELEQLLETVGMKLPPAELSAMVREIDLDGNGEIDFEEFCAKMNRDIKIEHTTEQIENAFKAFARNAPEGMIRVHDLRNALKTYMHREVTDVEIEELVQYYQDCFVRVPGHDHEYFNYQEYIDIMAPMVPQHDE
jgi:calmodulin